MNARAWPFGAHILTVVAASVTALILGGPPAAAAPATGPITGLAGKCVDVNASTSTNGTQVQLYTCNGTGAQQWTVGADGTIRALGKCLNLQGGGNANGTRIQIWDCLGDGHQQWSFNSLTGELVNPETGKCLDARDHSSADSTPLQIWQCNGQTSQRWVLPTGTSTCGRTLGPGETAVPVTFNGVRYQVAVYIPAGVSNTTRLPLVINLHGTSGSGSGQLTYSNMKPAADAGRYLVAAPSGAITSGSGYAWNVPNVGTPPQGARDDVGFLTATIDTLTTRLCADPARVYGTGYSGGGRMMSAFACARPDKVAAIAPVAGLRAGRPDPADTSRPDPASCQPSRAVPVIAFHGQQDATNPYWGGGTDLWEYSVPVAQQRWATIDGCTSGPSTSQISTHVTRTTYQSCSGGAQVTLYSVTDGGHTWPGTPNPSTGNGTTTHEIDANALMWQFFQNYRL